MEDSYAESSLCPECGSSGTQYYDIVDDDEIDDGFSCDNPNCSYVGGNVI